MNIEKKSFLSQDNVWQSESLPGPVYLFGSTTSVLDEAWKLAEKDLLPIWGSVLAQSQSNGRGQTRRLWHSPEGNIYAALRLPLMDVFNTMAAAPALSFYLCQAFQNLGYFIYLKWPNDLIHIPYGSDKAYKIGGILLEERQDKLIAGIGINVLHAPQEQDLRKNHALSGGCLPSVLLPKINIIPSNNSDFIYKNPITECLWLHLVSKLYLSYSRELPKAMTWQDLAQEILLWKGRYVELDDGYEKTRGILQGLGKLGEIILQVHNKPQLYSSGSLRLVAIDSM